jgi:protein-tyrosine phosphatase
MNDDYLPPPVPNSYWVQPRKLLAGEYPGALAGERSWLKLRPLLDAGVTFFLDLTHAGELEPYAPLLEAEAARTGARLVHRRLPIRDVSVPATPQEMVTILDTIDQAIADGHVVYVHCWGGIGRTGTVVGCHLVRHGLGGEAALVEVDRLFRTMAKGPYRNRSPETDEQEDWVRNWSEVEGQ